MTTFLDFTVPGLFYFLFFTVPLVLYPYTSELFEFNKMVLVYLLTVIIAAIWFIKCILKKKILFRRTILDIPLLIFIASQLLSTIFSIDIRTSLLGYYSRFHGGLASTLSYSLLYWAFVSNMDREKTLRAIKLTLVSAVIVSIYGILEHFGIDKNIWVQDVKDRVFSTLGQPNWLAAYIIALTPITWALSISDLKIKSKNFLIFSALSIIFFNVLLFTKSRSGILGFIAADLLFWALSFLKLKKQILIPFIIHNSLFLMFVLLIGSPLSPSIKELITKQIPSNSNQSAVTGPALETGGTESGKIRKIVWKGALEIWMHYPILGTGVETFAYSYYNFRPVEHNLVSEWDFLYNKAHNEYLNFLATCGAVGFLAYLSLIGFSIYQILKSKNQNLTNFALVAGYASILVTNFFGFSVVPVALIFFLYPALAVGLQAKSTEYVINKKLTQFQIVAVILILCAMGYMLFSITKYWYADVLYAKGKNLNDQQKYVEARGILNQAITLSPSEPIFYDEFSQSSVGIALALNQIKETDKAKDFINEAISESQKAVDLSPANVNLKRSQVGLFLKLALIDPNYLLNAKDTLLSAIKQAPTDVKLYYNLGLIYARTGDIQSAISTLQKTIELKSNYKEARLAYAVILIDKKEFQAAKDQLNYILTNIDPNDALTKQQLEELK